MKPRCVHLALGVAACVTWAAAARAHFPISRGVAVSPEGAVAIALPGFGIAIRNGAAEPFSYACDALLGVAPSDTPAAMAFTSDGSLLLGSASGLRSVDARGCPRADFGGELQREHVARLAVHPVRKSVVYAVTEATLPRVWRSEDGGATWAERASVIPLNPIAALTLDPSDPEAVYVTQTAPGDGSSLHVSKDGGATFSTIAQKPSLTLLDVQPAEDAGAGRFWAVGRSATAMGIQGFSLFGAASPSGPWSAVHDVRFFGGFAREGDTLWIGDEAGGVYRSTDSGGAFTNVSPPTAVSCLSIAQGTLWGCTPGLAEQTALVTWNESGEAFDSVVALASVTRMVECSPETDVATACAAAWAEWKRDILVQSQPPPAPEDAGVPPTGSGGSPSMPPGLDASTPTPAPLRDGSAAPAGVPPSDSGCSLAARERAPRSPLLMLGALGAAALRRRRRASSAR